MNVRVFRTSEEAAHAAAAAVAAQLARKPASVLGLPTGRTSLAVYDELARLHEAGGADFSRAHTFNVDEFVGLSSTTSRATAHSCKSICSIASICRAATCTF